MDNKYKKMLKRYAASYAAMATLPLASCSVSEDRAGTTGSVIGGAGGAALGNKLGKGKVTGSTTGDTLLGGFVGAGIGDMIGRKSTTLKGVKKTEVPNR